MNYGEQVLRRLLHPDVALLIVGAVLTYGSGRITRRFSGGKAGLICKGVGCAVAIIGAVWLFA